MRFDDVIEALKRVDGEIAVQPRYAKLMSRGRRWKDLYGGGRDGRFAFDEACHVRKEMDQAQKSARTRKASARTRCTRSKPTALLEEAVIAAAQMKRQGGDGGRVPQ